MPWRIVLLVFSLIAGATPASALTAAGEGRVVAVADGDTVTLDDDTVVRLVGIQAPKLPLGRPDFAPWPLADAAKAMLETLALDQRVALFVGDTALDRHGRRLAHLYRDDGLWLQGEMLRRGLARVYSFRDNRQLVAEMLAIEAAARTARVGLWADPYYAVRPADPKRIPRNRFELVEGRVMAVAVARGRAYLNFGPDWRTDFTARLGPAARRLFAREGIDLAALEGRRVRVRGWVDWRNGPMIEVTHPEQIEILGQ